MWIKIKLLRQFQALLLISLEEPRIRRQCALNLHYDEVSRNGQNVRVRRLPVTIRKVLI